MVQAQGADSFRVFPFYLATPLAIVFFILGTKNSKTTDDYSPQKAAKYEVTVLKVEYAVISRIICFTLLLSQVWQKRHPSNKGFRCHRGVSMFVLASAKLVTSSTLRS